MEQPPNYYSNDNYPGRGLGIAGLVLGIITMMMAFIPCIGALAFLPGIAGIVLSAIALGQSKKVKVQNGIAISGLVCSIIGVCIALVQFWFIQKASKHLQDGYIQFEQSGGFDSLSTKMRSLEVMTDSLWHHEEQTK
jgi:hypothetical protein